MIDYTAFGSRLNKSIHTWPSPMRKDFRQYIRRLRGGDGTKTKHPVTKLSLPYWILLPIWLTEKYNQGRKSKPISRRFLNDVLWGQYCLFLTIRIQDDLYDKQADGFSLIFAADQFLIEAYDIFSGHMGNSKPFWKIYRDCLEETTHGIIEVDKLQQASNPRLKRILDGYSTVSSIFKIGSAAICCKAGRLRDYPKVAEFADGMAAVGQVFDDFQDIKEDLEGGKANYVARYLARGGKRTKATGNISLEKIAANMIITGNVDDLLNDLKTQIRDSELALAPLKIRNVSKYIKKHFESLDNISLSLHRERVRCLFGKRVTTNSRTM
jgi:hypothetical protein